MLNLRYRKYAKLDKGTKDELIKNKNVNANKILIVLDILTSDKNNDILGTFCMQTGYKLQEFIKLVKLENKDNHCFKAGLKNKSTEIMEKFYTKVKLWADQTKKENKFEDICDSLIALFA